VTVAGDPADVSVFRPVLESGGEWEPHVRAWFEATVKPDWVCMDVGANIGLHTLTLAVLAPRGEVIAIEAGTRNFMFLEENTAALDQPHGAVTLHHAAAWDETGLLKLAFPKTLQGCGFISGTDDTVKGGELLRAANPNALPGEPLPVLIEPVQAIRLDDLSLPRLDLIKLDVEGAEARVLAGAAETLRRSNTLLLTEYNPGCAVYSGTEPSTYFDVLLSMFTSIRALESDGSLSSPISAWSDLSERLSSGRGWEDLVCSAA
jgi:FkbM family methyltransferase